MNHYNDEWKNVNSFIINYELIGSSIIVNYYNGEKKVLPYRQNTEKEILEMMEKQAHTTNSESLNNAKKYFTISLFAIPFFLLQTIKAIFTADLTLTLYGLFGITCGAASIMVHGKRIKWIKKLEFFLTNKNELSQSLEIIKENKIDSFNIKNDLININTVDKYSLQELKELKKVLEEYKYNDNVPFVDYQKVKKLVLKK